MKTLEPFTPDDDRPEHAVDYIHNPCAPATEEELKAFPEEAREIPTNQKGGLHE